jgi:anti-anti-sigma factor
MEWPTAPSEPPNEGRVASESWPREPGVLSPIQGRQVPVPYAAGRVGYLAVLVPLTWSTTNLISESVERLGSVGCRVVILDLRSVPFIDSSGMRALLALRDLLGERHLSLRLVVPEGHPVDRTLRLLKFECLFALYRHVDAAWRAPLARPSVSLPHLRSQHGYHTTDPKPEEVSERWSRRKTTPPTRSW